MYRNALEVLQNQGSVGVLPTDTVYGLVAHAHDKDAVHRLYGLKSREHKPGTLIAAGIEQLVNLGIDKEHLTRARDFWPGPVSVVVPAGPHLDYLSQGVGSLAVRVPDNPELIKFLRQVGPLVTSSANQPGEPPAATIQEAQKYFGDQVDFYINGGDLSERTASTVIKFNGDKLEVLREGAVRITL